MSDTKATRYGRTQADWAYLLQAGRQFLVEQARMGRMTSYTELNTVLGQRTGARVFDFDLDSERAAIGELRVRSSSWNCQPAPT